MKYSLYLFVLIKFILQYSLIDASYDLQRDEYLHLDQAQHLAWGYMSVPPFTSWISWIIGQLGNQVFWVHFFPALFGALTIVVVWKTIESLGGKYFALYLGAISVLLSAVMRLNSIHSNKSVQMALLFFHHVGHWISKQIQHPFSGIGTFPRNPTVRTS